MVTVRRRDFVAGGVALGLFGGSGVFVYQRRNASAGGLDSIAGGLDTSDADGALVSPEEARTIESVELETIDAPGSEAGSIDVPTQGRITFLEFFATTCSACERMMEPMRTVHDDLGDEIQFVSVTNQQINTIEREDHEWSSSGMLTRSHVADWWAEHDGNWTVALDGDHELTRTLDVTGYPYSFLFDESNRLRWSAPAYKAADEIREPMEAAIRNRGIER